MGQRFDKTIQYLDRIFLTAGNRIGPLDGVRTIAISLVIFRHCFDRPLSTAQISPVIGYLLGFGWMGVSLFFCLSGFLIGGMIYQKLDGGRFSFSEFYINRAFRILPIAYAMMIYTSRRIIGFNYDTLINFTYLTNIFHVHSFQGHFWSLCVEEQFYILFPTLFSLLFLIFGKKLKSLVVLLFSMVLLEWAFRAISLYRPGVDIGAAYYKSQYQVDFLLMGVIAAILYHGKDRTLEKIRRRVGAISTAFVPWAPVAYIGLAYFISPMNKVTPGYNPFGYAVGYPLITLLCFFSIFGVVTAPNSLQAKFLSKPIFRWIAAVSYSMYVTQFQVIDRIGNKIKSLLEMHPTHHYLISVVTTVVVYFLITGLSVMTFLIIERPFQIMRKKIHLTSFAVSRPAAVLPDTGISESN